MGKVKFGTAIFLIFFLTVNFFAFFKYIKYSADTFKTREEFNLKELSHKMRYIKKGDFDGNGNEEAILRLPDRIGQSGFDELQCISPFEESFVKFKYFFHIRIPSHYSFFKWIDIDNDGKFEIPIAGIENGEIYTEFRDLVGRIILRKKLPSPSIPIPTTGSVDFSLKNIDDLDGDGRNEMIFTISGEFNGLPRGFLVYDLISGTKKWEFLMGATPHMMEFLDLDKDGKKEIIFTAWAPHNGISFNGFDDDHSYIGVLDANGRLLWKKEIGGYFSDNFLAIGDVNNDELFEIATSRTCHRMREPDPGLIALFDALSGKILNTYEVENVSFSDIFISNVDSSPESEILVGDSKGKLRIFNNKLEVIKEINLGSITRLLAVERARENHKPYIFVDVIGKGLRILDGNLKIVSSFKEDIIGPSINSLLTVSNGKTNHFLLNANKLFLLSMNENYFLPKFSKLLFSNLTYLFLLLILSDYITLKLLRERRLRTKLEIEKSKIENSLAGLELAQEIAHGMKGILFTIQLGAEALISNDIEANSEPWLNNIPQSILQDTKKLRNMVISLMKILESKTLNLKKTDINLLIKSLVDRYKDVLKNRIDFEIELDNESVFILIDEVKMEEALSNIIENAIDAIEDKGKIKISTSVVFNPVSRTRRGIIIEIEDNGKGIPSEKIEEIFKPYFTTKKEGSGLGLTISQRVIEAHGGRIEVTSKEGFGTRFAVYLPG